ncbi:class I SAM-dependent methyltransferase [Synechococcus sp. PCC 6312]|uniref:class I SAM-dependent methyltransferase n=1 Tax=Synechococcus sp. (strain ATCC 27167 / PCC 6312) TaxID=195253 RepID=UPI00029ECF3D|nr:class I SAM-dependent methyltransferase [Synechococcus sp. PCC 6312]AFY62680.1 methylase involved in ubiquinone/menaquinone biosynthesis [Synechococcus sp. PCC 6312]
MADVVVPPHWTNITQAYYPTVKRDSWYSSVAQTYDRVRPRYPQGCIQQALDWANLSPGSHILELGCGPGIASLAFAELGFHLTCLEPSKTACEIAQAQCRKFSHVEIINTTFEAWSGLEQSFDAVLAATSFHWLDPAIRCQKTAELLVPHGPLILLWNVPPQPHPDVFVTMTPIYREFALHLGQYEEAEQHLVAMDILKGHILDSGYFEDFQTHTQAWQITYSVVDYLALLGTLSPYIVLAADQRETLFRELEKSLTQAWGDTLTLDCLTGVQVTHKKTAIPGQT